jgi:acyl carrier protein
MPFESRVRRILVTEEQRVSAGDPLLEIEPSADTRLQIEQAQNDYQAAKKAAEYMRQRFELKLATNDQLLQATQALDQAQAKLERLLKEGDDKTGKSRKYHKIMNWLTARISREISISPDAIRPDEPLTYYGLASVQVLTLVGDLEDFLGARLHPSIAWEYPTIALLADHLASIDENLE